MEISASITSGPGTHAATVVTNGVGQSVAISPREGRTGSSLNGGELLCLALATCYGNDLIREAAPRGIQVERVDVTVQSVFGDVGEPARTLPYQVRVGAYASQADIASLIEHTDRVAEVQNTLRQGMPVVLDAYEAVSLTA